MMDYEHQPANHSASASPGASSCPRRSRSGAPPLRRAQRKVVRYAGFKEEVYLGRCEPDPGVLAELGLDQTR